MRRLFAYVRRLLALDSAVRVLGEIAHQAIRKYFIPEVNKALRAAKTDSEKERLTELLDAYERYSDPKTMESRTFGDIAEKVIHGEVSRYNLGYDDENEVASQIAYDFYQPFMKGERSMMDLLRKFNVNGGPKELEKYWGTILKGRAYWRLRDLYRQHPELFKKMPEPEEEGMESPTERLHSKEPSPSESADAQEAYYRKIWKDMQRYVQQNSHDKVMRALFDQWMAVIQKIGPDNVNMDKDVYAPLLRMYDVSRSGLAERFMTIKRLIESFYRKELGVRMTDALRKKLHISAVELIAFEEFRRRFAAWMLGVSKPTS